MTLQFFSTDMPFKHKQFEQDCFDQTMQKLEREQASPMVKVEVGKGDVVSRTVYKGCANDGARQDVLPGHKLVKDTGCGKVLPALCNIITGFGFRPLI